MSRSIAAGCAADVEWCARPHQWRGLAPREAWPCADTHAGLTWTFEHSAAIDAVNGRQARPVPPDPGLRSAGIRQQCAVRPAFCASAISVFEVEICPPVTRSLARASPSPAAVVRPADGA